MRCRKRNRHQVTHEQSSRFFPFLLAAVKVERERKVCADPSPCMHSNMSESTSPLTTERITSLLSMSSIPHWVSQRLLMTRDWIVVKHAHSQVRHTKHKISPNYLGFGKHIRYVELEKAVKVTAVPNTNYVMKKDAVNGEWRDAGIGITFNLTLTISPSTSSGALQAVQDKAKSWQFSS